MARDRGPYGAVVEAAARGLGMKLSELAEGAGICHHLLWGLLRRQDLPTLALAQRVAGALGPAAPALLTRWHELSAASIGGAPDGWTSTPDGWRREGLTVQVHPPTRKGWPARLQVTSSSGQHGPAKASQVLLRAALGGISPDLLRPWADAVGVSDGSV